MCVCKIAQVSGWQLGRPYKAYNQKPSKQRQKAMRIGRGGKHLFTSINENGEEDVPEGSATHSNDPWLAPINSWVEHNLVWGRYINPIPKANHCLRLE